jgi:hypothetical protein
MARRAKDCLVRRDRAAGGTRTWKFQRLLCPDDRHRATAGAIQGGESDGESDGESEARVDRAVGVV